MSTLQWIVPPLSQLLRNLEVVLEPSLFLHLVSCTTMFSYPLSLPRPSLSCYSLLSSQFCTPDLPSRHIHGQTGLLKTSLLPAMEATTVPSELALTSLSANRSPDAPSFCSLRAEPREESGTPRVGSPSLTLSLHSQRTLQHFQGSTSRCKELRGLRPSICHHCLGKVSEKCLATGLWLMTCLEN